jgi:hypothetical protein
LTNPDNTNIINFDLWKQAAGGRHQIGTLAGFKSEQVAGFLLECMAGFVGIRRAKQLGRGGIDGMSGAVLPVARRRGQCLRLSCGLVACGEVITLGVPVAA